MTSTGPSLDDLRRCTHNEKASDKKQERMCDCKPGEIGWTLPSGPHYPLPTGFIITDKRKPIQKIKSMQTKLVHTTKWENKKYLTAKFGVSKARSTLRISPKVLQIFASRTGAKKRGIRGKKRAFAEGLPAQGKAHFLRRQIFCLFHENPEYLDHLLHTYSSNIQERKTIDEMLFNSKKRETVAVTLHMPVLERAYGDLIVNLSKKCKGKLSEEEKKKSLDNHILLKNKTKWRYNLCRLIELRLLDQQRRKADKISPFKEGETATKETTEESYPGPEEYGFRWTGFEWTKSD